MKVRKEILQATAETSVKSWRFDERLITKEEAALLLNVTRQTIDNWIKGRKVALSVVYLSKNVVRLKISEVIDLMQISEDKKQEKREVLMKRLSEYISIQTLAGVLGVCPGLLYDIENGKKTEVEPIPFVLKNGHKRIKKADLYAYIDERTE